MAEHEVIEAELVGESSSIELRSDTTPNLFGASRPEDVIDRAVSVADALKEVLRKQKLISNIQGKEYPLVEAWTLLGSMLGVFPVLAWSRPLPEGAGWEARVEAHTLDGRIVGAAEASCSRSESRWRTRDDYALRGMAQTRATSRAMRQPLGFVMTLAGFEALGEDELPGASTSEPGPSSGGGVPASDLTEARNAVLARHGSLNKAMQAWANWHPESDAIWSELSPEQLAELAEKVEPL